MPTTQDYFVDGFPVPLTEFLRFLDEQRDRFEITVTMSRQVDVDHVRMYALSNNRLSIDGYPVV